MLEAHRGLPIKQFNRPDNVVEAVICAQSGKLATETCPNKYVEYYLSGTEPTEYCDIHLSPIPVPNDEQNNDGINDENNNENINNEGSNNENTEQNTQDQQGQTYNQGGNQENNNNNNNANTTPPPTR
ncbi:hypothetical protein PL321_13805 [Caloramator sp. mosi_1]|uniref:hypothetical protein n=1 Tax=Caloramator sp. mosi_1 TaxID=3023090 RepID=UPI00235E496F|nr:hypothetical protein [Caloramator sp. mosi_1]WDC83661.1 hypothetical protein PL321_13805 [Caloramator sp. mosi_1]